MLERIECLERPLQLYIAEHPNIQVLTANEWQLLEKLLSVATILHDYRICKSKSVASSIIPHVRTLHAFLSSSKDDSGVQTLKEELNKSLKSRLIAECK